MKKYFIPEGLFLLVLSFLFAIKSVAPEKLAITNSFQTGQVYLNGAQPGKDGLEQKMTRTIVSPLN
ncbi:MAG: hypothetical protein V4557_11625 [Bacteroidota bacterium]